MVRDLTSGKPFRLLWQFSLSFVIGNICQYFYNMIDALVVGRALGPEALAAVGSTGSITFLIIGFTSGMASGFGVVVGQLFGARDRERLHTAMAHILYLSGALMIVMTLGSCLLTRQILTWMNTPEDMMPLCYDYLIIIFGGMSFTMLYNVLSSVFRSLGDSKTPLIILIIASVLNAGLDILFVTAIPLGTFGAGLATIMAQAIAGFLCLLVMIRKVPEIRFTKDTMKFSGAMAKRLLSIGCPMGFQFSITAIGTIFVQTALNGHGSAIVAALTAGGKVTTIFSSIIESVGVAISFYCAQNLGAGKFCRIRQGVKIALWMEMVMSAVTFVCCYFIAVPMASLFLESGKMTEEMASVLHSNITINTAFYPILGILVVIRNAIQGIGYSAPTMIGGALELIGRAVISFAFVSSLTMIFFASPLAWILADCFFIPCFLISLRKIEQKTKEKRAEGSLEYVNSN